jgi:hypothetical protein
MVSGGWKVPGQKPLRKRSVETLDFAEVLMLVQPMAITLVYSHKAISVLFLRIPQ